MKKWTNSIKANLDKWLISLLTGFFLFIALYIYRVYHIDQVEAYSGHSLLTRALIQSSFTSLVFYTFEFHIGPRLTISPKWKRLVVSLLATFVGLNFTYLWFNYFYNWTEWYWSSYVKFLYEYPLVMVVPIVIGHLTGMAFKRPLPAQDILKFLSDNGKQGIQIKSENLLCIKSEENYVEIYYKNGSGVKSQLLRNTLKNIEGAFDQSPYLKRCHRSYLVNPNNIQEIHNSPKSVMLSLADRQIPVSEKYRREFIT